MNTLLRATLVAALILLAAALARPGYTQSLSHGSSVPTAPPAPQPYRAPAPTHTPRHAAVRPHPKAIVKHPAPPRRAAVHQQPAIRPQSAPPAAVVPQPAPAYVPPAPAVVVPQPAPAYVPPAPTTPVARSFGGGLGSFAASGVITIPVILSLTGPGAFVGQALAATMNALAADVNRGGGINGRPVKFEMSDDQTQPAMAVQLAVGKIGHGSVVIGGNVAATCAAMAPLFANGPIDWCLSPATSPAPGSALFTTSINLSDDVNATMRFFREKGWTRLAILSSTDASGQAYDKATDQALAAPDNRTMTIVAREHFGLADLSVSAQVARIQAAGAQALLVSAIGTPLATVLRGVHDAGLALPVVAPSGNIFPQELQQFAAFLPTQLYFPGVAYVAGVAPNAGVREAQATYTQAMASAGLTSTLVTGFAWDAGLIIVDALRHLGPTATSAQIYTYIADLHGWNGIHGVYDFTRYPQRGLGVDSVVMVQWNGSAFTAASSFGGALR